jgi:hypothetical protein
MAVKQLRESWPDDRLNELDKKVAVGFAKADERFNVVDERFDVIDERFKEVDKRFDKVEGKIDTLDGKFDKKFDRLTFWILASGAGIITTLIGILGALIGPAVL